MDSAEAGWSFSYREGAVTYRKSRPKPALSEVERAELERGTLGDGMAARVGHPPVSQFIHLKKRDMWGTRCGMRARQQKIPAQAPAALPQFQQPNEKPERIIRLIFGGASP